MRWFRQCMMGARAPSRRSTLFWLLLTFVALSVVLSVTMFRGLVEEDLPTGPAPHTLEGAKPPEHPGVPPHRAPPRQTRESLLLHAGHLLSLLEQFLDERMIGLTAGGRRAGLFVPRGEKSGATPEHLLSHYYETELIRLNNAHEKEIDSGYAENVVHSDTYWSPFHATRRGYGLEGSIFIGITHSQEEATSSEVETACAATVQNIYDAARWPLGVFTGVVEVTLRPDPSRAQDTTTALPTEPMAPPTEESPAWTPPPPSVCTPRAYLLPSCAERGYFCPTDNIRVRQVRVGPRSADGGGDAGGSGRRTPHPLFSSVAAQRYATMTLYRGETYVMFLHAGVRLVYNWDVLARMLWLQLPSRSAVLSQPPLRINPQSVRLAWDALVVKHVEGILVASNKLFSNRTTNASDAPQPREEGKGNGVEHWIDSIRWALDLEAVRLHSAEETVQGSEHEETVTDLGMTEEEVARFVFNHDAAVFRDTKKTFFKGAADTPETEGPSPLGAQSRRDVQFYWLRHFQHPLQEALLKDVVEQNLTACLSGVQMKGRHSGGPLGPLFRLHTAHPRRLSRAMQDARYMRPAPFHACGGSAKNACPNMSDSKNVCNGDIILPYLQQSWVTTDFLFTRAEAFFDFPRDGVDGYKDPINADTVPLDPFLGFVGTDEEAVLLSARLWTHGWDFFSSTEPIAFVVAQPPAEADASGADTPPLSSTLTRRRQESVARLRHVLFGENRTAAAAAGDANTGALSHVERYGLGRRRSRKELFHFSGLREAMREEGVVESKVDAQYSVDPTCPAFFCHSEKH